MKAADKKKLKELCNRGLPKKLGLGGPSSSSSSSSSTLAHASGRTWIPLPADGSPGIDWDAINHETREETDVLYCTFDLQVVGCRYYSGKLRSGIFSDLVREPDNQYDPNAIRCNDIHGTQVGHIKREQAACLARILDDTSPLAPYIDVLVEEEEEDSWRSLRERTLSLPVVARVYGPPQYQTQVTNYLVANRICIRRDGSDTGGSPQQAPTVASSPVRRIVNSLETPTEELDNDGLRGDNGEQQEDTEHGAKCSAGD